MFTRPMLVLHCSSSSAISEQTGVLLPIAATRTTRLSRQLRLNQLDPKRMAQKLRIIRQRTRRPVCRRHQAGSHSLSLSARYVSRTHLSSMGVCVLQTFFVPRACLTHRRLYQLCIASTAVAIPTVSWSPRIYSTKHPRDVVAQLTHICRVPLLPSLQLIPSSCLVPAQFS